MKAAVVSHGEVDNLEFIGKIMREADLVVCADGGCEYAIKCNIIPDALIGDLDSINKKVLDMIKDSKCTIIRYPKEKDFTDTQLAVNYAIDKGADEIIMLAATGDRLDHSLANIFLLVKLMHKGIKVCLINEKNIVYIIDKSISLSGKIGDIVSLIPIGGDVKGIFTEGLQYKLSGQDIKMGDSLGISNIFISNQVNIKIKSGILLVIKAHD